MVTTMVRDITFQEMLVIEMLIYMIMKLVSTIIFLFKKINLPNKSTKPDSAEKP